MTKPSSYLSLYQDPITQPSNQKTNLIRASDDLQAVMTWLSEHRDSEKTLISYRKEAERFLMWLEGRQLSLASVAREDVLDYQRFLANPLPNEKWCGPCKPRLHPEWKPFAGGLTPSSIQYTITTLSAMYRYLGDAGYLSGNPFSLAKFRKKHQNQLPFERFLDERAWEAVLDTLSSLPEDKPREIAQKARARWVITLFYLTGARRSEAANALMGDWYERRGLWWWRIQGKGGVLADVPVSQELLEEMRLYRASLGLSATPQTGEDTPLICHLPSKTRPYHKAITDKAIYLICKEIFARARAFCHDSATEKLLSEASTHWLRHTSASHQLEAGVPLLMVSQNLRHASIQTTRRYLHTEQDDRHHASEVHSFSHRAQKEKKDSN